ncbi:MAG: 3-dehydroquinate synthase [Leptospirales bacterium]
MKNQLSVKLESNSYTIQWDPDFDALAEWVLRNKNKQKNGLITNELVYSLYKDKIAKLFPDFEIFTIPDGEAQKNIHTVESLAQRLLECGFTRNSCLWALGGGVIGDITGFLASIYMRGIDYFQIPTTLLSMVDSSVGGKTGVNLPKGKNMIGAFYQPQGVFINITFLNTLEQQEIKCGLSEIIKSALILDSEFYEYIENSCEKILEKDLDVFSQLSYRSVAIKAFVVGKDEKEQGLRAILNLGHTLAHALESHYGYKAIKHGEAVSAGIHFATLLSSKIEGFSDQKRVENLLDALKLTSRFSQLPEENRPQIDTLIQFMKGDKKNIDSDIRFVLLRQIGNCKLPEKIADKEIWEILETYLKS